MLLINSLLTVEEGCANAHAKLNWNIFIDFVITKINEINRPIVYILWGANAKRKKNLITNENHFVIESKHPSPLAVHRGDFFGSKPFSKTNIYLKEKNMQGIDWRL